MPYSEPTWEASPAAPATSCCATRSGSTALPTTLPCAGRECTVRFPELPPVPHLADIAAPALLIALAIGRIGDVINGEHLSSFTDLPWAWIYTDPDSFGYGRPASHPAVAYELIFCLVWAGVLWLMRDRIRPHGMLFALFFAGYSAGRFFISFVRQEANTYVFGFNEAQLVALAIMLVTVPLLIYRARLVRPDRRPTATAQRETGNS